MTREIQIKRLKEEARRLRVERDDALEGRDAQRVKAERLERENFSLGYNLERSIARVDALQFALVLAQAYAKKRQDEAAALPDPDPYPDPYPDPSPYPDPRLKGAE